MKTSTICPCCSCPMLRHLGHHQNYWFCRSCWQPMPDFGAVRCVRPKQMSDLSSSLRPLTKPVLV